MASSSSHPNPRPRHCTTGSSPYNDDNDAPTNNETITPFSPIDNEQLINPPTSRIRNLADIFPPTTSEIPLDHLHLYPVHALKSTACTSSSSLSSKKPWQARIRSYYAHALLLFNVWGIPLSMGPYIEFYYNTLLPDTGFASVLVVPGVQLLCLCVGAVGIARVYLWKGEGLQVRRGSSRKVGGQGGLGQMTERDKLETREKKKKKKKKKKQPGFKKSYLSSPCSWWRTSMFFALVTLVASQIGLAFITSSYIAVLILHGILTGLALGVLLGLGTLVLASHYKNNVSLVSMQGVAAGFAGAVVYTGIGWRVFGGGRETWDVVCACNAVVEGITLGVGVVLLRRQRGLGGEGDDDDDDDDDRREGVELEEKTSTATGATTAKSTSKSKIDALFNRKGQDEQNDQEQQHYITPKHTSASASASTSILLTASTILPLTVLFLYPLLTPLLLTTSPSLLWPTQTSLLHTLTLLSAIPSASFVAQTSTQSRLGPLTSFIAASLLGSMCYVNMALMPSFWSGLVCGVAYGVASGAMLALGGRVLSLVVSGFQGVRQGAEEGSSRLYLDMSMKMAGAMLLTGACAFVEIVLAGQVIQGLQSGRTIVFGVAAGCMLVGGLGMCVGRWMLSRQFFVVV